MGPARPTSQEEFDKIFSDYHQQLKINGETQFLNDKMHLLSIGYTNDYDVSWWVDAGIREFNFSKETGIPSGKYHTPPTVFRYREDELQVAVFDGKDLYVAPYLNMHSETQNCMMSAKPRKGSISGLNDLVTKWTHNFFAGEFNALHGYCKKPLPFIYGKMKTNYRIYQYLKKHEKSLKEFCTR